MEKNDLITIVVPIYNVEKYLERCVDSIIKQSYENLEIILVDDGSTDDSGIMCDEYRRKDSRISVIHKENGGLSDARNVGLERANGKYIAFIDSDDYIDREFVRTLYKLCIDNNANIAQCSFKKVYDNDDKKDRFTKSKIEIVNHSGRDAVMEIFGKDYVEYTVAWNKLYETKLFNNIRYPKGKLHEDEATTYKLLYKADVVAVTNEELYYYYIRENSITNKKYTLKRLDYIEELEEQLRFFENRKETDLYNEAYYRYARSLIKAYFKCKRNVDNSLAVQEVLLSKYQKCVKDIQNASFKRKTILKLGDKFPNLYEKLFLKD